PRRPATSLAEKDCARACSARGRKGRMFWRRGRSSKKAQDSATQQASSATRNEVHGAVPSAPGSMLDERRRLIQVARGKQPADIVFRNGQLVNVFSNEIYPADIAVVGGRIAGIGPQGAYGGAREIDVGGQYLVPGLIEAHTHIEDALLVPNQFAVALAPHGTTTSVSDPHEIANVSGVPGLHWMLAAADGVPLRLMFTLPSCVPASQYEGAG